MYYYTLLGCKTVIYKKNLASHIKTLLIHQANLRVGGVRIVTFSMYKTLYIHDKRCLFANKNDVYRCIIKLLGRPIVLHSLRAKFCREKCTELLRGVTRCAELMKFH